MSAISWHEILLHGLKITAVLAFCHVTIRVATRRACLPCTGAEDRQQAASERRTVVVFIKSTREQLRGLCSLDTPPLFIPRPPAVTLTFYFSLLIHSQIIFTKKKKKEEKKPHMTPLASEGSGRVSPTGPIGSDAVESICLCQQPSRSS